jgi:hypothetical protein
MPRKPALRDAAISIASPVCGLRPERAARSRTSNVPKPGSVTLSPLVRADEMASTTASTAASAPDLDRSAPWATASTSSRLFI